MSAHVVTIAQQKGGAGKTTIAVQLATTWLKAGRRIAMVDVDPQGSLGFWYKMREETLGPMEELMVTGIAGWKLASEVDRLRAGYDIILIDSPPHAETDAKVAVRAADLVLVPVQPSPMDLWATQPTIDLARRENGRVLLVLNRMPPRGRMPEVVQEKLKEGGLPLARATLGNRVAFAASMMDGRGVVESRPRSSAADEIVALAGEITKLLKKG